MKKLILKIAFHIAASLLRVSIGRSTSGLTPSHLIKRGFVASDEGGRAFYEPNVKGRDRVTVVFEREYYRVYHSDAMIFVALESSREWFDAYYMLIHPDNRQKK